MEPCISLLVKRNKRFESLSLLFAPKAIFKRPAQCNISFHVLWSCHWILVTSLSLSLSLLFKHIHSTFAFTCWIYLLSLVYIYAFYKYILYLFYLFHFFENIFKKSIFLIFGSYLREIIMLFFVHWFSIFLKHIFHFSISLVLVSLCVCKRNIFTVDTLVLCYFIFALELFFF